MASPYAIKTLIRRTFGQRFTLARLSRYPAIGRWMDRLLFKDDAFIETTIRRIADAVEVA